MAIYTGKTNMIDKVVVTNGAASEEMDFVYVTNAAGTRELVFEKKLPAPDDNTQVDPPRMRKWSASMASGVSLGKLFGGALDYKMVDTTVQVARNTPMNNRAYTSLAYQISPHLKIQADGIGGYRFTPHVGIRGNGWTKLGSSLRYPTEAELTDLGVHAPYTGIIYSKPIFTNVSGLPLSTVFNKLYDELWKWAERNDVRRTRALTSLRKPSGANNLTINSYTPNGYHSYEMTSKGIVSGYGAFGIKLWVGFSRTSSYDQINLSVSKIFAGRTETQGYLIKLNKNVVSKEEPPMSQLVETTNITRGIGGNPKVFRMGDGVNFTVNVKGEYI